jgi:hypothetical protein
MNFCIFDFCISDKELVLIVQHTNIINTQPLPLVIPKSTST